MPLTKEEKSELFRKQVQTLLDTGEVKNYTEIISALGWSKQMFSAVINKRATIPNDKFIKFSQVYPSVQLSKADEHTAENLTRIDAMCAVILSTLAEVLAHQRNQPVAKLADELVAMVNNRVKQKLGKL